MPYIRLSVCHTSGSHQTASSFTIDGSRQSGSGPRLEGLGLTFSSLLQRLEILRILAIGQSLPQLAINRLAELKFGSLKALVDRDAKRFIVDL